LKSGEKFPQPGGVDAPPPARLPRAERIIASAPACVNLTAVP
jgi:hypothetical protein